MSTIGMRENSVKTLLTFDGPLFSFNAQFDSVGQYSLVAMAHAALDKVGDLNTQHIGRDITSRLTTWLQTATVEDKGT